MKDYISNELHSLPQLRSRLKWLIPAFGALRAAEFGTTALQRYKANRVKAGASRTTINREVEALQRAWTLALQHDPPKVSRPFHFDYYDESTNVRTGFLEFDFYELLFAQLPPYLKPLLLNGYHVPCRIGELRNLLLTQLDFRTNQIVLDPGTTKNKEGRRMPMYGDMRECLLMQKAIRDEQFPKCRYVFFGVDGARIVDFRKAWNSACIRAGLQCEQKLLFHDLRRSAARNMRRAGIDEPTVMRIGGWKTNAMFRRYSIVDGKDLSEAGKKMEEFFSKARTERGDNAISTLSSTIQTPRQLQ